MHAFHDVLLTFCKFSFGFSSCICLIPFSYRFGLNDGDHCVLFTHPSGVVDKPTHASMVPNSMALQLGIGDFRFHNRPGAAVHEGSGSKTTPDTRASDSKTHLTSFLRFPSTHSHVAVSQGANRTGDFHNQTTERMEGTSTGGKGLFSHTRLRPQAIQDDSENRSDYAKDTKEYAKAPEEVSDSEFMDDQRFPPLPPPLIHPMDKYRPRLASSEDIFGTVGDPIPTSFFTREEPPERNKRRFPWWQEYLASPVKRFLSAGTSIRENFTTLKPAMKLRQGSHLEEQQDTKEDDTPATQEAEQDTRRGDRPVRCPKTKLRSAVKITNLTKLKVTKAIESIEKDYYANS